ncbi:MAG: type II secretion system GspH family protein [Lentisphaeraceae bacterium]|nr:type II secretion system GspH family protein [Lentisphaeraceae bacterium]
MRKFTLIELLVVVAIIGILSSILLPALGKARARVQASVCLNNQRQISIAMISYIVDHNDYAPDDNKDDGSGERWFDMLVPGYLPEMTTPEGGLSFLICPNGRAFNQTGSNIAENGKMVSKNEDAAHLSTANATTTETMMLMDTYKAWRVTFPSYMDVSQLLEGESDEINLKHFGKANVTFLDGSGALKTASYFLERSSGSHTFWDVTQ